MSSDKETKHEKFLRIMQRRLGKALEDLRLVGQLSSNNYQNTPEEAEDVVLHLSWAVWEIAKSFNVPYSAKVGDKAVSGARPIDEVDIAKAIEHIVRNQNEEALQVLRAAILEEER